MSAAPRDQLAFIQALRGLAASAVVLYHARVFIDGGPYLGLGTRLFGSGGAGVDLFFVISGFIMMHTTRDVEGSPRSAMQFLARRFARIWPVYAVALLSMWAVTRAIDSPTFATTWTATAKTLAFYPLAPPQAAPFFGYPLLHVGWTLDYEAFFYLLFAVSLLAPRRWRLGVLAVLFGACLIALPLATKGQVQWDAMKSYRFDGYAAIATNPIIWDFGFGVLIALVYRSRFTPRDRGLLDCFAALAAGVVLWQLLSGYRLGHGPNHWGLPMAVLVLALALRDKAHPFAVPRWLTWLGDVSFSLYLFHVLPQMAPRIWKHEPQLMTGGGFFVACLVAALVLAYLGHRFLERGLSEHVRRALLSRSRRGGTIAR
jgi:exopolysaccharide production protein ExoZ